MNYGNTLMAKGDFAGALEYFHRAQALVPSYPVLFVNLGIAEGAVGHARLAEQHFKKALRLGPTNPDCYSYYGRWLLSQSRAGEALPLLRKAVELAPADARTSGLLAGIVKSVVGELVLLMPGPVHCEKIAPDCGGAEVSVNTEPAPHAPPPPPLLTVSE